MVLTRISEGVTQSRAPILATEKFDVANRADELFEDTHLALGLIEYDLKKTPDQYSTRFPPTIIDN